MKIGLDIHGTIDAHRKFFAEWTQLLKADNERIELVRKNRDPNLPVHMRYPVPDLHEVHIMTGPKRRMVLESFELEGIWFSHFFSIVDECEKNGVAVMHDEKGDPWMDQYEWNRAKGDYARKHNLDLVIDDSTVYPNFFTTPIATFQTRQEWKKKVQK